MYECFNCLKKAVIWQSDCDLEDIGLEGTGVVHFCHCSNCGAEIQYICRQEGEEDETQETTS